MTIKSAAFFAIVGMALVTILVTVSMITDLSGVIGGFVPLMAFLASVIQWVASLSLLVFFVVFHRAQ